MSNAADKLSNTRAVCSPRARERWTSFFIDNKAVSVECPGLYAD